jgi:nanoRNase/pAp phosphatase (c-di-AMP/oligoRNAs hydrolase)
MQPTEINYALFASYDEKNKQYKISLRSNRKTVNQICEKYGGGGHAQACGIKVKDKKTIKLILSELDLVSVK